MKRMRSRHNRSGNGGGSSRSSNGQVPLNRNHVFESNGPDLRIRGTAQQLFEKYLQLGRDATGAGDRIQAEAYFQHAEHYFRTLNAMNQAAQAAQQERAERQRAIDHNRRERREVPQAAHNPQEREGSSQPAERSERSPSEEGRDRDREMSSEAE